MGEANETQAQSAPQGANTGAAHAAPQADAAENAVSFFDVDGTLIWRDPKKHPQEAESMQERMKTFSSLRPSPATYEAFRHMRTRGNASFICTGRPYYMIFDPLRELEPTGYIALAGAYVQVGEKVVRNEHVPFDLLMQTAQLLFEAGIDVEFEGIDQVVGLYASSGGCLFPRSETVHDLASFERIASRRQFAKLCTRDASDEVIARARQLCDEHFTICNMNFGTHEFSLRGVDKGTGIAAALAELGHDRARTYAFGDSENDLSMADAVETFVAMGNAFPVVKERASFVTKHVAEDGVAAALEHFGLV